MKELLSKLEALKGKMLFYDNGVDDCIKVVKENLKSHKTRQPIQVTEGEFKKISDGEYYTCYYFCNKKIEIALHLNHIKKITEFQIYHCDYIHPLSGAINSNTLSDGVIAANVALKKMFEDVSEVVE